ncbi:hypothetical protein CEY16_06720 [Halalkalibacillus sediminis]|uniref:Carbonic anhydrase n=1 Tax=Halalkalibacillus sediminis TaxID=2018042 RepID=A0A2I0QTJ4_9BACI|nr:carbonic anhydrase [Halalkalibacillus sediminis]PKR77624.1 hypothetical protein CEY16_06720 [Halalkalibacillus sediminis]
MAEGTFATVINCMDGRVQVPVNDWMREKYKVDFVDTLTEAGPNKFLLEGSVDQLASIQAKIGISVEKHGSNVVAVAGHHDCAGNPIDAEEKKLQIKESVELIQSWGYNVEVVGLYVNDRWEVEQVV